MPLDTEQIPKKTRSSVNVYVSANALDGYELQANYTYVSIGGSTTIQEVYINIAKELYEKTIAKAGDAEESAIAAKESEENAKASENLARQWAINPLDEKVPGYDNYSSMHFALLSERYQELAETFKQAAEEARDIALSAKADSEDARDKSQASEQAAASSASSASTSATQADASRIAAQSAEAGATTQRTQAEAARQGAEAAQVAAKASEDSSRRHSQDAAQALQDTTVLHGEVEQWHDEVGTNTGLVSDLAEQVTLDAAGVQFNADKVEQDREAVEGLKTETQIYRDQSEQFKNDAEAAAAASAGGLLPVGGWDASTGQLPPPPTDHTQPWYRITVAGTLPGLGELNVGDNIYWSRTFETWFAVDNTDRFTSINGYTHGNVELTTGDIPENGPQYHTQPRVRSTTLSGMSETSAAKPTVSDTLLSAIGKIVSKLWNLAVGDISGLGSMATRDAGTSGNQHRTNTQNEQKFVTLDTAQTITAKKALRVEDRAAFTEYGSPPTETGRTLSLESKSVEYLEDTGRFPSFPEDVHRVLHYRVGGIDGHNLGGMVFSRFDDKPDLSWSARSGVVFGNPTGGFKGNGSINTERVYINNVEVFEDASGVYTAGSGKLSNAVSNMLNASTNEHIRASIGAGTGDATVGTGNTQVRTNTQNDARFVSLAAPQTITGEKSFRTQFRLNFGGDTGRDVLFRQDNNAFFIMRTDDEDSGGTWTDYRPFTYRLDTGEIRINSNATGSGAVGVSAGVRIGNPSGGTKEAGSLNIEKIYINNVEVFADDSGVFTAGSGKLSDTVKNILTSTTADQIRTVIGAAESGETVSWGDVTDKPAQATRWPSWSEVSSKPSTFAPSKHSHDYDDLPISASQVSNWDESYKWGNHGDAGYAKAGTGPNEVRTNTQNDGRYGRLGVTNTWETSQTFAGSGISLRRQDNGTEHIYFYEDDGKERALIWAGGEFSDHGLSARVKDSENNELVRWRMNRNGQFHLDRGVFRGDGSLLTNIPSSAVSGLGSTGDNEFRTNKQNDELFLKSADLGNFVTTDTEQTITGEKTRVVGATGALNVIEEYRVDDGGNSISLAVSENSQITSANWPTIPEGDTHYLRYRMSGSSNGSRDIKGIAYSAYDTNTPSLIVTFSNGITVGNPTGGFKGTGSINMSAGYINNSPILTEGDFGIGSTWGPKLRSFTDHTVPQGIYAWAGDTTDAPAGDGGGAIKLSRGSGASAWIASRTYGSSGQNEPVILFRSTSGTQNDWGAWRTAWHTGNLRFEWTSSSRTLNIVT